MKPVVSFRDVSFAYRKTLVLKNVNFEIKEGEFVGIIGPNGGGKSTLLKLILGFLTPNQGEIQVFGISPEKQRALIGYVPQNLRYDRQFPISVFDVVITGLLSQLPWYGHYSQADKNKVKDAIKRVGLERHEKFPFGNLSGGQTQKALIARALVSDPKLLLLDEPTTHLDAEAEEDIYELLDSLRHQLTMLMVTHNLQAAVDKVDKVICVEKGVDLFTPEEICKHYGVGLYHPPLLEIAEKREE